MKYFNRLAAIALGAIAVTSAQAAPSIGDTVTCMGQPELVCSSNTAIVGSGIEFMLIDEGTPVFNVDFSSGLLTFTSTGNSVGQSGLNLMFSDSTSPFTQAILSSNNGFGNFDQSNITLSPAGVLNIRFGSVNPRVTTTFFNGASFTVQLAPVAGNVPEPASWAMMLAGFGAIGFAMRRRNASATSVSYTA